MTDRLTFCENCRNDVRYTQIKKTMQQQLKGELFTYVGIDAFCEECGAEVFVPELEDAKLKALYGAYRERHDMISLQKIIEIPEKYGIGKRPFSLLLGWGELTYSRYCDGDMPSKPYSDLLKRIYDEPEYYLTILESNKEKLTSQLAYEKSKRITNELVNASYESINKMDIVVHYLIFKCEDITPLALQKALYYVQGFYFAFMDEYLFDADCEAWVHVPVYRDMYLRFSSYRYDPIKSSRAFDDKPSRHRALCEGNV